MKNMKKWIAFVCIVTLCISLIACGTPSGDSNGKPTDKSEIGDATTLVTMEINPEVELTVDENGIVASVYGANEDGQILLYGEVDNIVGYTYEEAAAYVTKLAASLGYLNEKTEQIRTYVTSTNEETVAQIKQKLGEKIEKAAKDAGVTVEVSTEAALSLLNDLRALQEKYPDNVKIQALSADEYRLALSVSEREGVDIRVAVEYDKEEMITRINAAHEKLEAYATEAYLAAKAEATRIFDAAMGVLIDGAYNEFYVKNLTSHIKTYYYGAVYQAYKTTARTYRSLDEIVAFGKDMKELTVGTTFVDRICEVLNVPAELKDQMKNEDGVVTLNSLCDFCESYMREHEVSAEIKAQVEESLSEARAAIELAQKGVTVAHTADLTALQTQIEAIITTVNTSKAAAMLLMGADEKAELEACIEDLNKVSETVAKIIRGELTTGEVAALADEAEAKAVAMEEKIKADLSEEELATVEARVNELKAGAEAATEAFEERLSVAEAAAKEYIEKCRNERLAASKD